MAIGKKKRGRPTKQPSEPPPALDVADAAAGIPLVDLSQFDDDNEEQGRTVGDVIVIDPLRIRALQQRGVDTHITRVRIERWRPDGQGAVRVPGEFSPDVVTTDWLKKKFGPGRYTVKGVNAQGNYIASGTARIGEDVALDDAAQAALNPDAGHVGAPRPLPMNGGESFAEKLLLVLLPAMFQQRQAPPQDDSLRETMAAMGKLTAIQLQVQAANSLKQNSAAPAQDTKDNTLALLKAVLEQSKPAAAPKQMGLGEFLPLLQMGMSIGSRMNGGAPVQNPGEKQLPPWLEVLPGLADTIGVPLIATIAQSVLPKDTAEQVLKLMTEHLETRKVEAEAEAATADAAEQEPES